MTAQAPPKRTALVFRVGARVLAVGAAEVSSVARRPALTRVPQAPAALAGLGVLKGRATPVIELALLLGEGEAGSPTVGGQVLVLRGEDPVALAVDHIEGVRECDDAAVEWLDLREIVASVFQRTVGRETGARISASAAEAGAEKREDQLSFVQFTLSGQKFAFPMAEVQAVVRASPELIEIPEADPVVRGLMILGEAVAPVVELADLLGLPRPAEAAQCFVVEIGGVMVALKVDRALGALRVGSRDVSPAPAVLNRGAGEARVTAITRTPSGLTAILSSKRLFDEPTMMRLNALAKTAPAPEPQAASAEAVELVVVFRLGAERYGLAASAVDGVALAPSDLASPPNAPAFLKGLMSHRGQAIPVIDARTRLGAPSAPVRAVILVRRGAIAAGLLVDAVERLAHLPRSSLDRAPAFVGDAGELFASVSATDIEGRLLLIVDADALLGLARRDLSSWSPKRRPKGRA